MFVPGMSTPGMFMPPGILVRVGRGAVRSVAAEFLDRAGLFISGMFVRGMFIPPDEFVAAAGGAAGLVPVEGALVPAVFGAASIFWIASCNWLSESSMNWPEVTTRSPGFRPLKTWS